MILANVVISVAIILRIIAVCTYRLVMISIERSETAQKSALEIQGKFSPRQNAVWDKIQSETKFSLRIFFLMVRKKNFFRPNLVSDWICLRLNFVSDWICLKLNFVLDYVPQLYFVCNLLIPLIDWWSLCWILIEFKRWFKNSLLKFKFKSTFYSFFQSNIQES